MGWGSRMAALCALLVAGGVLASAAAANGDRHGASPRTHASGHRRTVHVGAPTVSIGAPVSGGDYTQGQSAAAAYSCAASPPAYVSACSGSVPDGAPIPTATRGVHSFTVRASDDFGGTATRTVVYVVTPAPPPASVAGGSPPALARVRESARRWREGERNARISDGALPVGTTFSFALNEPAAVTLSFVLRGSRAGSLSFPAHPGTNRVAFDGWLSSMQRLRQGRYTLTITATDTAGRGATPQSLGFTIVR